MALLLVLEERVRADGGEVAEVAVVGAHVGVQLEDVVDDLLPLAGLESAAVAAPRELAGDAAVLLLLVAGHRPGKLREGQNEVEFVTDNRPYSLNQLRPFT